MNTNLTRREKENNLRISLSNDTNTNWWSMSLGVSPERLRDATSKVGSSAVKVWDYLKHNK